MENKKFVDDYGALVFYNQIYSIVLYHIKVSKLKPLTWETHNECIVQLQIKNQ